VNEELNNERDVQALFQLLHQLI